ncbi:MAG: 30S ribosomal protein S17, partial [Parcubacteria group bacterium]|nr:30S ribosomal protein S17 [Parcubacteria group bacterium]
FEGTIISDKMQNTVVVKVEKVKQHPKYLKRYKVYRKYKAHVVDEGFVIGDKVVIEECRPISKDKTWRVIKKIEAQVHEKPKKPKEIEQKKEEPKEENEDK